MINEGKSPIQDEYIEIYLLERNLNPVTTLGAKLAYSNADYFISATQSTTIQNRFFDTSAVKSVIQLGLECNPNATIVIKSTVPVGFTACIREKYKYKNIIFSPESFWGIQSII